MSKENLIDFYKPLFEFVSPEQQKKIALEFVETIRGYTSSDWQREYTDFAKSKILDVGVNAESCLRLAISTFDYCLADNIRPYEQADYQWTDRAAVYFRSDAFKMDLPIVAKNVLLKNGYGVPEEILFFYPEQTRNPLYAHCELKHLTPEILFWSSPVVKSLSRPEPICSATRQDVFLSLMRCGVNPLSKPDKLEHEEPRLVSHRVEPRRKRVIKKKSILYFQAERKILESWRDKTSVCWERVLCNEKGLEFKEEVLLIGSGTAANETSLFVARDLMDKGRVYRHPFWYYENEVSVFRLFGENIVKSENQADILLINLEPTNHFTLADPNSETPLLEVIENFVQRAVTLPNERFLLIIDVTTDPNLSLSDFIKRDLPQNLILIKTVSATKHQKGGRDYFFGVISFATSAQTFDAVSEKISNYARLIAGELPDLNVVYFPRPTSVWLAEKRRRTSVLNRCLAKIRSFPNSQGWSITPYTFHSFVFPPASIVNKISEFCAKTSEEEIKRKMFQINDFIYKAIVYTVERSAIDDVEIGDSFGLPVTRINTQGGESNVNGVSFRLKIPRISPGYNSSEQNLSLLATELLNQLDSCNLEVLKAIN